MAKVKYAVVGMTAEVRLLVEQKIVAAVELQGGQMALVARHGTNKGTLAKLAKKEEAANG